MTGRHGGEIDANTRGLEQVVVFDKRVMAKRSWGIEGRHVMVSDGTGLNWARIDEKYVFEARRQSIMDEAKPNDFR
jgi:hypothetical protein